MKRLPILLVSGLGMLPVLVGCGSSYTVSTTSEGFAKAGTIMAEVIQERIEQIPYQHREELLGNLLWLKQQGEQAIPLLSRSLNHVQPKVRSSSAWVLGAIGDKRSIPYLQRYVNDADPIVRLEVGRALLQLGDYSHVATLIDGLESEHSHVRFLCYSALNSATGKSFEYDLRSDAIVRKRAVEKWRQWWSTQSADTWFQRGQTATPGR